MGQQHSETAAAGAADEPHGVHPNLAVDGGPEPADGDRDHRGEVGQELQCLEGRRGLVARQPTPDPVPGARLCAARLLPRLQGHEEEEEAETQGRRWDVSLVDVRGEVAHCLPPVMTPRHLDAEHVLQLRCRDDDARRRAERVHHRVRHEVDHDPKAHDPQEQRDGANQSSKERSPRNALLLGREPSRIECLPCQQGHQRRRPNLQLPDSAEEGVDE
mmetsp:Transcript_80470/g.207126  ORF Transcript_80470/g.207126 Transcript_80470/m.207126 type:complete len:217 (-) Transcript_80470:440-1090(-)